MNNENFRIFKPFLRGLPIVVLAVLLAVLAAKKYLNYVTPIYESTAKLKLAEIQEGVSNSNVFKNNDAGTTTSKINTEIEVLKSSSLVEKTLSKIPFSTEIYRIGDVQTVELFNNSPISVESTFSTKNYFDKKFKLQILSLQEFKLLNPINLTEIKGNFGVPVNVNGGKILVSLNEKYINQKRNATVIDQYEIEFLSREKLLSKTLKNLDIIAVEKDVPVVRLNYKSNVPEKAALFVNTLSETYIEDYIDNKFKAANITLDFLKKEIDNVNGKLANAEFKIENYKERHSIINIPQETETDLRKIAQLKIQQSNLKMNLSAAKDLNNYIQRGKRNFLNLAPNFESFNDLLSTEMVKNIKKLQADKKELLLTYTPEHEKVKVIDAKLKDLIDYQVESIKNTERNLQIKNNEINRDISVAEQSFIGLPEKERMLTILNREFNLYEKSYNFLNEKRIDAEVAKSAKIAFHKVITPGEISKEPVSPIRSIIIIVAAIMGLLGSTLLIYLVHFAKAKVNDIQTIEKNSDIPIAFSTPYLKKEENISSAFLQNVLEMEIKGLLEGKSIITISSYEAEKTHLFHSKNLSLALKKQGRKVLVIDTTGALQGLFQESEYLDFFHSEMMNYTKEHLLDKIREKCKDAELCIIHNIPIKEGSLPLIFMNIAHQNLVVLDSRNTPEKILLKMELLKEEFKIPKLWFVLNKANYSPNIISRLLKFLTFRR